MILKKYRNMYILSIKTGKSWFFFTLISTTFCMCLSAGCSKPSSTVFEFKNPKIFLHVDGDLEKIKSELNVDGPIIKSREELGNANADFVIIGTGIVHWGSRSIKINNKSIEINGILIEAQSQGYRNVKIAKDGSVKKDQFNPFEPPWGYHPNNNP